MNYAKEAQDLDFAYKVRHALNESAESLPQATLDRLASARRLALSKQRQESPSLALALNGILAGNHGNASQNPSGWLIKFGMALPLLVLVMCLMGIYQHEQQHHISDLAELDAEVLVDELPPDAYVDTGFSAYLASVEE